MASKYLPLISTCVLFLLCYYTYVYEFLYNSLELSCKQIAYLAVFHTLYAPSLLLFIAASRDRKWRVPDRYKIPEKVYQELLRAYLHEEDALLEEMCALRGITVHMRTKDGVKRVCYLCRHLKPDRAFHCSRCKACVCRMDHHCHFLNNCIGASNLKHFLFLNAHVAALNYFCSGTQLEYLVGMMLSGRDVGYRISYLVIAAIVMLVLGVTCTFLAVMTAATVAKNTAMVEVAHPPIFQQECAVTYNKGCWQNCVENCGGNVLLWLLPWSAVPLDIQYALVELPPHDDGSGYYPRSEEEYLEIELGQKTPNVLRRA